MTCDTSAVQVLHKALFWFENMFWYLFFYSNIKTWKCQTDANTRL